MINKLKVKGKIEILDDNGKLLYEKDNLVVNAGLSWLCDRMKNDDVTYLDYIAVGTGSTAAAAADIALVTETIRKQSTNKTAGVGTFVIETLISGSEAQGTWREAGIFTALSGGTMFDRVIINFAKTDKNVTVRFTITFTNS